MPTKRTTLTEDELSAHWGVPPRTLQRWRQEGKGPRFMKLGGRAGSVRYPLTEVEKYETENLYRSTSEVTAKGAA